MTFCVIHGFLAFLSSCPILSLIVSSTDFLLLFHCTSTFTLPHSVALSFSSRVSCTFCHSAYNFSRSHLGCPLWNFIFSSMQCRYSQPASCGPSQYLLKALSAHPPYCFRIDASQVCSPAGANFDLLVLSTCRIFS